MMSSRPALSFTANLTQKWGRQATALKEQARVIRGTEKGPVRRGKMTLTPEDSSSWDF